jgi:hypothetical protein
MKEKIERAIVSLVYKRRLARADRNDFEAIVKRLAPADFLFYRNKSSGKLIEFASFLDSFGYDPAGKICLDIGSGYGDSQDIWLERGGKDWQYIERDLWLFNHIRLKGAKGWMGDHFKLIDQLPAGSFDFVWSKGGISPKSIYFKLHGAGRLGNWLRRIRRLQAPGGLTVICPYWGEIDPRDHWFSKALEDSGYTQLPFIEGHNSRPFYPVSWVSSAN